MKRQKNKNSEFWKGQAQYWKRRALDAERMLNNLSLLKSPIKDQQQTIVEIQQSVKKLNEMPIEILWTVMEYLDLESSLKVGAIAGFSKYQVYKYHFFNLEESTTDFPFFCESIRKLIDNEEALLEALLVNKRFKAIVEMEKVLALAANFGFFNILKKLLEKGIDPSDDENLCIRLAAQNGHTEIVKELLKNPKVDPATCANYPILYASRNGHTAIVEILSKDERVDPSDVDNWAIKKAAYLGHVDIVHMLKNDERVRNKNGFEKFWRRYMKRSFNDNIKLL